MLNGGNQAKIKHEEVKHFQQNLDKPGAKEHDAKYNEKVAALKEELNKHKEQHKTLQAEEEKTTFKKANSEKIRAERRARLAKPHHKISSAGFQIAQAEANNLPYLEQVDMLLVLLLIRWIFLVIHINQNLDLNHLIILNH